jgi:uncharacterized repeat protein (TIGR04076 family)
MGETVNTGNSRRIVATVVDIKGKCSAGHEIGDKFDLSCHNSDGLCGFFYHDLFPRLSVMQFGGSYPWWEENQTSFEYECPDKKNLLTLKLEIMEQQIYEG